MKRYVIIGTSAAGVSCAETIRSIDKTAEIVMLTDEPYPHIYCRCLLSYYIADEIPEEKLKYREDDFFEKNNIKVYFGKKVVAVDTEKNCVLLEDNTKLEYDKLLIATGARSKMEEIPGVDKDGVYGLRTVDDAKKIIKKTTETNTAIILGGGLIGLKAAYALKKRGLEVTVVVKSPRILSQVVDETSAKLVQSYIEKNGIKILTGLQAKEICGDKKVEYVILEDGQKLNCGLVIIGKGVQPNIEFLQGSKIELGYGIKVNEYLQTNIENVYSAGDVAETNDLLLKGTTIYALWPNAVIQGKIAGVNMVKNNVKKYDGTIAMNSVEFFGLYIISCGITRPKDIKEYEFLEVSNLQKNVYKKFVIKDNKLVGFVLVGDIEQAGVYNSLVRKKVDISSIKESLVQENFDFAKILPLIKTNKDKFLEPEYSEIKF